MNSFEKEHILSILILFVSVAGIGFLYFSGDTSAITQEAMNQKKQVEVTTKEKQKQKKKLQV